MVDNIFILLYSIFVWDCSIPRCRDVHVPFCASAGPAATPNVGVQAYWTMADTDIIDLVNRNENAEEPSTSAEQMAH